MRTHRIIVVISFTKQDSDRAISVEIYVITRSPRKEITWIVFSLGRELFFAVSRIHFWAYNALRALQLKLTGSSLWALSIHPQILEILVGTSDGTHHFGLARPEYSVPALKVVHFDRSGNFGRSDRNVSFHLSKLLLPVPHFCILLTRTSSFRCQVKCCE